MMTFGYYAAVVFAAAAQALDYTNTYLNIKKNGVAGEGNPIMKFFFSKSPIAAAAWKAWPVVATIVAPALYGDLRTGYWELGWTLCAIGVGLIGMVGFLLSKKAI